MRTMDERLGDHIGGTVGDLNQAMLAIDVAIRKTVSAMVERLGKFQWDAEELTTRTQ